MHCSNVADLVILHLYVDNIYLLHHFWMLVSFLHVVKILPNFKENLYQGAPFTCYKRVRYEEVGLYQLYSIPYKPNGGEYSY